MARKDLYLHHSPVLGTKAGVAVTEDRLMTDKNSLLDELKELQETLELGGVFEDKAVVRKTFRVPVGDQTPVSLSIAGVAYRVANISEGGVGFLAERGDLVEVGQRMDSLELRFDERQVRAQGTVRHVTPLEDEGFLYGLSLEMEREEDRAFMVGFVQRARERFFAQ